MFGRLRLAPSVRVALDHRCAGACESCGLAWPWSLYVFRVAAAGRCTASNLVVLCGACSLERDGEYAMYIGARSVRDRMLTANNRKAGTQPLTDGRRRALIAARGGRCEVCGATAAERVLQVHHRLAVLQGGHDGEDNLQVLCFACHHHVQPCGTRCGAWAGMRWGFCRNCLMRFRLEQLNPGMDWEEIKRRHPGFVRQWKPGYEPRPITDAQRMATPHEEVWARRPSWRSRASLSMRDSTVEIRELPMIDPPSG